MDSFQILIFIGSTSMHDENKVKFLIDKLGFTRSVFINGKAAMITDNLYSGFFLAENVHDLIYNLKNKIYDMASEMNIGMINFFIINATTAEMFKSIWYDGFY